MSTESSINFSSKQDFKSKKTKLVSITRDQVPILESMVKDIVAALKDENFFKAHEIMNNMISSISCFNDIQIPLLNAFDNVFKISLIKTKLWESDGIKQTYVSRCLAELLVNAVNAGHTHTVVNKCKIDHKSKTVDPNICGICEEENPFVSASYDVFNSKGAAESTDHYHVYKCKYHFESVILHMFLAGLYNGAWAIINNADPKDVALAVLLGLYHDIAKPLTMRSIERKNKTCTSFYAHAELGAIMFGAFWTEEMSLYMDKKDFTILMICIRRHMCGYHGNHDEINMYRREVLRGLESTDVLKFLKIMRIGDNLGRVGTEKVEVNDEKFFKEQEIFESFINEKPKSFDLKKILGEKQVVLRMVGTSASGKSWFANKLLKNNPTLIKIISRDIKIGLITVGSETRLERNAYKLSYNIYKAKTFIDIKKAQMEWNAYVETELASDPNSKYKQIKVIETESKSNLPNYSKMVNEAFNKDISDAFAIGVKVVIIDTMINLFAHVMKNCLLDQSSYFCIDVHINAFVECTKSVNIDSIEEQIHISGPYSVFVPIYPDAIFPKNEKYPVSLQRFTSLTSDVGYSGIHKPGDYRPDIVYGCIRTPNGEIGYEETISSINTVFISLGFCGNSLEQSSAVSETLSSDHVETKDMNLAAYYDYLLVKYDSNIEAVNAFIASKFFTCKAYLKCSDEVNPEKRKAHYQFLEKIVSSWYKDGFIDCEYSANDIESDIKLYKRLTLSIVIIKYIDGRQGPEFWNNFWALQSRGAILFIPPNVVKFFPGKSYTKFLGFKMPRGAEVVTGMTKNIETQDIGSSKFSRFDNLDPEQKDTCDALLSEGTKKMCLSGKADGSQFVATIYTKQSMFLVKAIVAAKNDLFLNMWVNFSLEISDGKLIVLPSTQGTFIESGAMAPYMVTCLLVGCNIVSRIELAAYKSYIDAWETYGKTWIEMFLKMPRYDKISDNHCFAFEAICDNRRGLFGDTEHHELAIKYSRDRLIFLGYSIDGYYIPGMLYHKYWNNLGIDDPVPFEEPLYWEVNASQVNEMMEGLNEYISSNISKFEYLSKFPPANLDISNPNDIENSIIDCEGWVVAANRTFPVVDSLYQKILTFGYELYGEKLPDTSYSKLKTPVYYMAHKLKLDNLPKLCELAKFSGHIFPILASINELFACNALNTAFIAIGNEIMDKINLNPDSEFLRMLKIICKPVQIVGKKPFKDPFYDFDKRPRNSQYKIVLNLDKYDASKEILLPIYKKYFTSLDLNSDGIDSIVHNITMRLEPWSDKYIENVSHLTVTSPLIQNLIFACIHISIS